jgi:extracellular elastinolytic metalloproteinase
MLFILFALSQLLILTFAHQKRQGVQLPGFYSLPSHFEKGDDNHFSFVKREEVLSPSQLEKNAKSLLSLKLQVQENDLVVRTSYQDEHNGVYHLYVLQKLNDMPLVNSPASIATDRYGNPLSFTDAWVPVSRFQKRALQKRSAGLSASQALVVFAKILGQNIQESQLAEKIIDSETIEISGSNLTVTGLVTAKKTVYKTKDKLSNTWALRVQQVSHWYNAFVSMDEGQLLGTSDWVQSAIMSDNSQPPSLPEPENREAYFNQHFHRLPLHLSKRQQQSSVYRIFPSNPKKGSFDLTGKTADPQASPQGWHNTDSSEGNNAISQSNFFSIIKTKYSKEYSLL